MEARRVLGSVAPSPEVLAARRAVRSKTEGAPVRTVRRDFAFDPNLLTDPELAERLAGCKVVWVNSISGAEEQEHVRGKVDVSEGASGRQVSFLGSAYRTVRVSSITSITGGRRMARV
jgi:hypothetical protein